ncbi:hypothetical protein BDB13_3939 [Rhodococcus sp. OK302]|nr:hypothetical protein BDB13_3939 [Rhodococcus sp. OK302]
MMGLSPIVEGDRPSPHRCPVPTQMAGSMTVLPKSSTTIPICGPVVGDCDSEAGVNFTREPTAMASAGLAPESDVDLILAENPRKCGNGEGYPVRGDS